MSAPWLLGCVSLVWAAIAIGADPPAELTPEARAYLVAVNDDTGLDSSPALDALLDHAGQSDDAQAEAPVADSPWIDAHPDEARGLLYSINGTYLRCDSNPAGIRGNEAWLIGLADDPDRVVIVIGPSADGSSAWAKGDPFAINARFYKRMMLPTDDGPRAYLAFIGAGPTVIGMSGASSGAEGNRGALSIVAAGVIVLGGAFIILRIMLRRRSRSSPHRGPSLSHATADRLPEYDDTDLPPEAVDALEVLHTRSRSSS
ncbi:MAG: hypothetical protein HND57_06385 [Planctomycetes bacterium]|nr:hypothetical protein [Planctomycetota bacterium]